VSHATMLLIAQLDMHQPLMSVPFSEPVSIANRTGRGANGGNPTRRSRRSTALYTRGVYKSCLILTAHRS
jgi:hypothetical protein